MKGIGFFIAKHLFLKRMIIFRAELNKFNRIIKKDVIQYLHGFGYSDLIYKRRPTNMFEAITMTKNTKMKQLSLSIATVAMAMFAASCGQPTSQGQLVGDYSNRMN